MKRMPSFWNMALATYSRRSIKGSGLKERSATVIELRIGIGRCRVDDESTSPDRCGNVDTEWHDGMHTGKGRTSSRLSRGAMNICAPLEFPA